MLQAFINIWRVVELRNKILFTLGMLAIYRIGSFIPLPGVDQTALREWAQNQSNSVAGTLINFVGMFTGGNLGQSTIFALGIAPYISASIIFQLLATVLPSLQQLQKEGPTGRQKIQEWTRYATVPLCLIQASVVLGTVEGNKLVYATYAGGPMFWTLGMVALTAGTIFLMWLGEQIDRWGIGNGVSLIIAAGIVSRMPDAVMQVANGFSIQGGDPSKPYSVMTVVFLLISFVIVVAGAIAITQGQRRIPIQQAKHTRGRRVYGGQKTYLPLRVNHGGVMPIIFASTLMIFPAVIFGWLYRAFPNAFLDRLNYEFQGHGYLYILLYVGLIYFFSYFWTTVQFQPKEMATQLRDHGSFIPGLRPGPRTAEYLETVMERITYVGAGFLALIAVIPTIVSSLFGIPFGISAFLGGTGLLIVVSVMLDFVNRIEASLAMRNYQGFLGGGGSGPGKRIRGPRTYTPTG
jgi:preprotein translocase subunit SecY